MIEIIAILLHFAPHAVRVTVFGVDARLYAFGGERLAYLIAEAQQALALIGFVGGNLRLEFLILMGTAKLQAEVFQLGLDIVQAQTVGQRRIEIVGLSGYLHLFVLAHRRESSHIVETVGEFYQQRAYVILHTHQHLLEVVELL